MNNKSNKAIVISPLDNVATAIKKLDVGETVQVKMKGSSKSVRIKNPIPFGHKFALRKIEKNRPVMKYGETIGVSTTLVEEGQHVHTHNLQSMRGKKKSHVKTT